MQGGMSCFFLAQALVLAATLLLGKEQDSWLVLSLLLSTFLLYNEGIYRGGLFWATASVLYVWSFCPLTLGVYLLLATRQRDRLPLPVCVAVPVSFFLAAASQGAGGGRHRRPDPSSRLLAVQICHGRPSAASCPF